MRPATGRISAILWLQRRFSRQNPFLTEKTSIACCVARRRTFLRALSMILRCQASPNPAKPRTRRSHGRRQPQRERFCYPRVVAPLHCAWAVPVVSGSGAKPQSEPWRSLDASSTGLYAF
eukprot:scaffold2658_cov246-Pinguiococcus_pyrenoidosus.AAC.7